MRPGKRSCRLPPVTPAGCPTALVLRQCAVTIHSPGGAALGVPPSWRRLMWMQRSCTRGTGAHQMEMHPALWFVHQTHPIVALIHFSKYAPFNCSKIFTPLYTMSEFSNHSFGNFKTKRFQKLKIPFLSRVMFRFSFKEVCNQKIIFVLIGIHLVTWVYFKNISQKSSLCTVVATESS